MLSGFSLVVAGGVYSLVEVWRLLVVVASLVGSMRLSSCGSPALEHRLDSCGTRA